MMFQNGPIPFVHPVTGRRIGPYEFYQGNAHLEHENVAVEEPNKDEEELKNDGVEQLTIDDNTQQDGEKPSEEVNNEPEVVKQKGKNKAKK